MGEMADMTLLPELDGASNVGAVNISPLRGFVLGSLIIEACAMDAYLTHA